MTSKVGDLAEARVKRYLSERGYTVTYEPDLGIASRPDFLITAGAHTVVAEVKAFETYGILQNAVPGQVEARSLTEALKPVRRQISAAAGQLRDLKGRGWPLIAVLSNPGARPIPFTPYMVMSAMYGDLEMQAPMLQDGSLGDFRSIAGRNGKLTNDHPYLSAVVVVRREDHSARWAAEWIDAHHREFDTTEAETAALAEAHQDAPKGDDIFVEVYETVSETAVPLPRDIFNGPRDTRWVPSPDRTALVPLDN